MKTTFRKTAQRGFTLIELIITIVIIGILAAVAIPKFLSLSGEASNASAAGVAAALASGSSVNYAKRQATAGAGVPITKCSDLIVGGVSPVADIPSTATITGVDTALGATGIAGACEVTLGTGKASFQAYGA